MLFFIITYLGYTKVTKHDFLYIFLVIIPKFIYYYTINTQLFQEKPDRVKTSPPSSGKIAFDDGGDVFISTTGFPPAF
jgi:hypothetical protein